MNCRSSLRTALPTTAVCLVFGAANGGCRPTPPSASSASSAASAAAPTTPTTRPLTEPAGRHPAPADTPDLDRAESAAAAAPRDPAANLACAFTYYKIKAYTQAAPAFEKVHQLRPRDPLPLLYLGWTQMAIGTLPDAIDTFQKVTALPTLTPAQKSDAFLALGDCQYALHHDEQAAEAYARSLGADSKQGMASLALGTFAAGKGRAAQARSFFTDATHDLTGPREKARAWTCLGLLSEQEKNLKAAAAAYQKALALDPENGYAKKALTRLKPA